MVKAFVFGKFLPFHKGHEGMINFALTKCDNLTVLVCNSETENIPGQIRKEWIEETFKNENKIEVKIFNYSEKDFPNSSVSSRNISKIWSNKFKELFPDYSLVVTSEDYGNYVAEYMNIKHISFDIPRNQFPVSATKIREEIVSNWNFLPDSVKKYFSIKVTVLGTESTGKSTLCEKLCKHFNCSLVPEVAREIISNSNSFKQEDLYEVAKRHAKRIEEKIMEDNPLTIIDTNVHITESYSVFMFNKELKLNKEIYETNKSDLYIYLNKDVEYFQDGTRLSETQRNQLDNSHRNILKKNKIDYIEVGGTWKERFDKTVKIINKFKKGRTI